MKSGKLERDRKEEEKQGERRVHLKLVGTVVVGWEGIVVVGEWLCCKLAKTLWKQSI